MTKALQYKNLFDQLNTSRPEISVPLSDTEYYALQISNMEENLDFSECEALANEIANSEEV